MTERTASISATARATRWGRVIVSLRTAQLRVAWLREELRALAVGDAADALEEVCVASDASNERAEALVHALVELLASSSMDEARDALREQARRRGLMTLERLLRRPYVTRSSGGSHVRFEPPPDDEIAVAPDSEPREKGVPDYGRGRQLTLGERKSLARRPPPHLLPKVLADPHPDVIRNLLAAPRLTEDDVIVLTTRRPNKAEVLHEVARHPRWCQRPRVRMALVMNPSTPQEVAMSMVALLRRPELASVVESTALHPAIRAAAQERLARRPPMRSGGSGELQ